MYSLADVPEEYHQYFFVNAGGPSRKVVSREVIKKKWQIVTLDRSHRILMPKYQKSAKVGCGFCGGLELHGMRTSQGASRQVAPSTMVKTASVDQRCHQLLQSSLANPFVALANSAPVSISTSIILNPAIRPWRVGRMKDDQKEQILHRQLKCPGG